MAYPLDFFKSPDSCEVCYSILVLILKIRHFATSKVNFIIIDNYSLMKWATAHESLSYMCSNKMVCL